MDSVCEDPVLPGVNEPIRRPQMAAPKKPKLNPDLRTMEVTQKIQKHRGDTGA